MSFPPFPKEFVANIQDIFGKKGEEWLKSIPSLLEGLSGEWNFTAVTMLPNLTYSYVAKVRSKNNSDSAILKLAPLGARTLSELAWYDCNTWGTPRVLRSDPDRGALLLECLEPGDSLKTLVNEGHDDDATEILALCISSLAPQKHPKFKFKHVLSLRDDLAVLEKDNNSKKIPPKFLDTARSIFTDLGSPAPTDLPLHGDIHHDNILRSGNGWRVIDPHGYLGPRAFEAGAMIRNPYNCFPKGDLKKIITRRMAIFEGTLPSKVFPKEEIRAWAFAYTMMAAAWSAMDHAEVPGEHLAVAEILHGLL